MARRDLIVAYTYGNLEYYENRGTDANPLFSGFSLLMAGGRLLDVGYYARPRRWIGTMTAGWTLLVGSYEDLDNSDAGHVFYFHAISGPISRAMSCRTRTRTVSWNAASSVAHHRADQCGRHGDWRGRDAHDHQPLVQYYRLQLVGGRLRAEPGPSPTSPSRSVLPLPQPRRAPRCPSRSDHRQWRTVSADHALSFEVARRPSRSPPCWSTDAAATAIALQSGETVQFAGQAQEQRLPG